MKYTVFCERSFRCLNMYKISNKNDKLVILIILIVLVLKSGINKQTDNGK